MNRRDLLRAAAALPFLHGLGCSRSPSWFAEALRRIRAEGKPGLVLRLPKDPELRCSYGHELVWMAERKDVEGLQVALQAVFLCLEEEEMRQITGARDGDALILIDGDGVAIDGLPLPGGTANTILSAADKLLDGPGRSRLRARASAARAAAPPEALVALKVLEDDGESASLKPWADRLVPLLVLAGKEASYNPGLEPSLASAREAQPRLPYGVEMGMTVTCDENPKCWHGACGACGLAVVTPRSRGFVKFLAR